MSILSGLILFFLAVALPFKLPEVKSNPKLLRAVLLVIVAHQIITWIHVYVRFLPTVDVDPISFNHYAKTGTGRLEGNNYAEFLRLAYVWLGGSHFFGCQVSQIAFSIALIAFIKLADHICPKEQSPALVLMFGLLPSLMLNTSVVLREAFQVASFLGLAYAFIDLRRNGPRPHTYPIVIGAAVVMIWIHRGLPPYLLAFLPMATLWSTRSRPHTMGVVLAICLVCAGLWGGSIWKSLERRSFLLQNVSAGKGLSYIDSYAEHVEKARSEFVTTLDMSSFGAFLITGPLVTLEYLFAPMPWQVRGTMDLYALFENILRLALFAGALAGLRQAESEKKREHIFLFCMFLSLELVWAAGTANWGTAFRHRVVAWGCLVLLGGPWVLTKLAGRSGPSFTSRSRVRAGRVTRSELRQKRGKFGRGAAKIMPEANKDVT